MADIPSYLRLHIEESNPAEPTQPWEPACLENVVQAFTQATGWELRVERSADPAEDPSGVRAELAPPADPEAPADPDPPEAAEPALPMEYHKARHLARAIEELLEADRESRRQLWFREAELAAGVPVTPHRDEAQHLAVRLEAVLKGGAEAVGCHAAALYMLDEATTQLKMRACWGLPKQKLLAPARPLRGAVADLEALVGHAVVLEDARLLPHWQIPEDFASAVCVPVASPTEPLGTLWMFCKSCRDFSDEQTNLVEIIAGRVASELQREMLLSESLPRQQSQRQLEQGHDWQQDHLPNILPLLDDWEVAGWCHRQDRLTRAFYDWFIPPDGQLSVALGQAHGAPLEAALTAAGLQAMLRSHADYPHTAEQLIERISETFWAGSVGGHTASLAYASVHPDTGQVALAGVGPVAVALGGETADWLPGTPHPLGGDPAGAAFTWNGHLAPGTTMVMVGRELARPDADAVRDAIEDVLRQPHRAASDLVQAVERSLETLPGGGLHGGGILALRRRGGGPLDRGIPGLG